MTAKKMTVHAKARKANPDSANRPKTRVAGSTKKNARMQPVLSAAQAKKAAAKKRTVLAAEVRNERNPMKIIHRLVFVAVAAILISSSVFTGCKKEPMERTAVEHQDDEKLAEHVKATFATSPSFKFPDVQVVAFKGTIQLSGFVVSDDQKQAAENLAKGVPGVQSVENRISLKH